MTKNCNNCKFREQNASHSPCCYCRNATGDSSCLCYWEPGDDVKGKDIPIVIQIRRRGEKLFTDASNVINGERQDVYGNPEDSFDGIAHRWTEYLKARYGFEHRLNKKDATFMMMEFKMERQKNQNKRDNLIDIAGYTAIHDDMNENE